MYHSPTVIELGDILDISAMTFDPESNELFLIVKLKTGKEYHPEMLYLSDGIEPRRFSPVINVAQWHDVEGTIESTAVENGTTLETQLHQALDEREQAVQENEKLAKRVTELEAALKAALPPVAPEKTLEPSSPSEPVNATPDASSVSQDVPGDNEVVIPQAMSLPAKKNGKNAAMAVTSDSDVPSDETVALDGGTN